jgi:hypothetical protein
MLASFCLGVGSAPAVLAALGPSAPPQESATQPALTPAEIMIYKKAQTLVDWTPRQVRQRPDLQKLRPAASQDQLPLVLDRAGQASMNLVRDFPQVSSDEDVSSNFYQGLLRGTTHSRFRYIVIPHPEDEIPTFEEYRTEFNGNPVADSDLRRLPLITYDFASAALFLSPPDQQDSLFRYFGTQKFRNRQCHVLGFAQNPQRARRLNIFHFRGKKGVLLVQGLAWIDSQTFQVLRISTWLLAPRPDLGLERQISTVEFFPAAAGGTEKLLWLPRDVIVFVDCRDIHAYNVHHYSNFKLFKVESTIKP